MLSLGTVIFWGGGLIFISLFLILYGKCKKYSSGGFELAAKFGGSFTSGFLCGSALAFKGINPFTDFMFWGIILCSVADILLEVKFPIGVTVFGAGHVMFVVFMLMHGAFSVPAVILWLVLYVIILCVFKKDMANTKDNKIVIYLYPAVLLFMAALAIGIVALSGLSYLTLAVGAVLFAFSDFLVASEHFGHVRKHDGAVIMVTYYLALYLFAVTAAVVN